MTQSEKDYLLSLIQGILASPVIHCMDVWVISNMLFLITIMKVLRVKGKIQRKKQSLEYHEVAPEKKEK